MGLFYATFSNPDGNSWLFQETTTRPPGTFDTRTTTYESVKALASALRRAADAQGQDETQIRQADQGLARTGTPGA
jgi:hypothetical protein